MPESESQPGVEVPVEESRTFYEDFVEPGVSQVMGHVRYLFNSPFESFESGFVKLDDVLSLFDSLNDDEFGSEDFMASFLLLKNRFHEFHEFYERQRALAQQFEEEYFMLPKNVRSDLVKSHALLIQVKRKIAEVEGLLEKLEDGRRGLSEQGQEDPLWGTVPDFPEPDEPFESPDSSEVPPAERVTEELPPPSSLFAKPELPVNEQPPQGSRLGRGLSAQMGRYGTDPGVAAVIGVGPVWSPDDSSDQSDSGILSIEDLAVLRRAVEAADDDLFSDLDLDFTDSNIPVLDSEEGLPELRISNVEFAPNEPMVHFRFGNFPDRLFHLIDFDKWNAPVLYSSSDDVTLMNSYDGGNFPDDLERVVQVRKGELIAVPDSDLRLRAELYLKSQFGMGRCYLALDEIENRSVVVRFNIKEFAPSTVDEANQIYDFLTQISPDDFPQMEYLGGSPDRMKLLNAFEDIGIGRDVLPDFLLRKAHSFYEPVLRQRVQSRLRELGGLAAASVVPDLYHFDVSNGLMIEEVCLGYDFCNPFEDIPRHVFGDISWEILVSTLNQIGLLAQVCDEMKIMFDGRFWSWLPESQQLKIKGWDYTSTRYRDDYRKDSMLSLANGLLLFLTRIAFATPKPAYQFQVLNWVADLEKLFGLSLKPTMFQFDVSFSEGSIEDWEPPALSEVAEYLTNLPQLEIDF